MHGMIKVAAAVPKLKVADCVFNREEIIKIIDQAYSKNVKVLCFPELSVTGYTCSDLFFQTTLQKSAKESLGVILEYTKGKEILVAIGLPISCDNQLFNCAALLYEGKILGLVPKTYIPNYGEFYEKRWFGSSNDLISNEIEICGQVVPIGSNILFNCKTIDNFSIGIEVCEDLWAPIPPSSLMAISGATVILNLSASNEIVSKNDYRRNTVSHQSASGICSYVYSSAGIGESTQDTVFGGHSLICENGIVLEETERFAKNSQLIISDVDIELLNNNRIKNTSFTNQFCETHGSYFRKISFEMKNENTITNRKINPKPFVPSNVSQLSKRCNEIFNIQVTGLAKRIEHTGAKSIVLGISGGLDSTLALLVAAKTCDFLELPRATIIGVTMPGFGTTDRTYTNAVCLMNALDITVKEISIKEACIQHFKDIGHDVNVHDVTYENTQARERTQILMDLANKENGLVVGTGDLSELALGWATYNGDHMSMYGVNAGVPKTLVRVLVEYVSKSEYLDKESVKIIESVLDTPVSPELLPPSEDGEIQQITEDIVGPYELHDFFLYYVVRLSFSPAKIFLFATLAFDGVYDKETILKWLKNFYRRFFSQQFKRSCLPDGPKVGTISLSPRSDWRMPSDAVSRIWLEEVNSITL